MTQPQYDVVVIGAGLAGLTAARVLNDNAIPCVVLDASDRVGGRVKTDEVDGFLLDYGFQVFLTAYPEAKQWLDFDALDLHSFFNGSLIWLGDGFQKIADPWRHPVEGVQSIYNKIGSLRDKMKVADLRQQLVQVTDFNKTDPILQDECTTAAYLQALGISDSMISSLFKPFLSGIFLEQELITSSRFFEHVMRVFALGSATLPADGIRAIPQQLARPIPKDVIRLNSRVMSIEPGQVRLADGEVLKTRSILIATDALDAQHLLPNLPERSFNSVCCFYFAADEPPIEEPILALNGLPNTVINNLSVPSQVASSYAPAGQALISVSVIGEHQNEEQIIATVRQELRDWFGGGVQDWQLLKSYFIKRALPRVPVGVQNTHIPSVRQGEGLYICGDHMDVPSMNTAMRSGRMAAETILSDFGVPVQQRQLQKRYSLVMDS